VHEIILEKIGPFKKVNSLAKIIRTRYAHEEPRAFFNFFMRIDKYLWCIRTFKTRSIATESCKKGHVKIDSVNCKPSKDVYGGEIITVRKNQINLKIEILSIPESRIGAKLLQQFCKDITPKEEFEKLDLLKYSKDYYRKRGTGRPTKKDRRDIDDYYESPRSLTQSLV
jgi:ribosome-associated heat shock protein Hsp15